MTFRESLAKYSTDYNISMDLLREVAILGADLVLEDFPQYPDGDPRTGEEIVDERILVNR